MYVYQSDERIALEEGGKNLLVAALFPPPQEKITLFQPTIELILIRVITKCITYIFFIVIILANLFYNLDILRQEMINSESSVLIHTPKRSSIQRYNRYEFQSQREWNGFFFW